MLKIKVSRSPRPPPKRSPKAPTRGAQGLPSEAPEGPWRPPRDPSDLRRPKGPLQAPEMTPKDTKSTPRGLKDRTQKNKFHSILPLFHVIAAAAGYSHADNAQTVRKKMQSIHPCIPHDWFCYWMHWWTTCTSQKVKIARPQYPWKKNRDSGPPITS